MYCKHPLLLDEMFEGARLSMHGLVKHWTCTPSLLLADSTRSPCDSLLADVKNDIDLCKENKTG